MDREKLQTFFFLGMLVGILALMFFVFLPYLSILIVAGTLAIVFEPFYQKALVGLRSESLAAVLTVLVVLILIFVPLVFFGTQVAKEAAQLYVSVANDRGTAFLNEAVSYFQSKLQIINPNIRLDFSQFLRQALGWILSNAGAVFSVITQLIFGFLLSMLAFYYFLKDGQKLVNVLTILSPLSDVDDKEIFEKLKKAVHSVVLGSLVIAIIQGILISVGFYIFGVPNGALWGAVGAVAALIPFIGTTVIMLPAIAYLFLTGSVASGLGLLIWGATAVGLIDNLLTPKLIERGIRIHPLLILFSVLGGLSLFGPVGFLLGPLILSLLFALLDIYRKQLGTS